MASIKRSKLDKVFSEIIRRKAKGHCERCGKYKGWQNLECSHFFGRRRLSTRHLESNVAALCHACHRYFTENPYFHTMWFQERIGSAMPELVEQAKTIIRRTPKQTETFYEILKKRLEELKDE